MSEYIPSMKAAAFYSFEFHKESVDKWESWIMEASERLPYFKGRYFPVGTSNVDKCSDGHIYRMVYICYSFPLHQSVFRNETSKHYWHAAHRLYEQKAIYDTNTIWVNVSIICGILFLKTLNSSARENNHIIYKR